MKIKISITTIILITTAQILAQENVSKIDLKHAESMNYNEKIANNARRLIGNVELQQENVFMYCDSVYLYTIDNNIKAFSNVKLKKNDSIEVFSNLLNYAGNIRLAQFRNKVILKDNKVTLHTDSLNYDINTNKAYYFNGGKIIDSTAELTSKTGYYFADEQKIFFKENVIVTNKDYTVYTDTLKYDIDKHIISFQGPTTISGDTATLYSEQGWYNTQTGQAKIWQNACYTNTEQIMYADTIFYDQKTEFGQGFKNIRLYSLKDSIILSSDYAHYNKSNNTTLLTQKALVTQIHNGDSIFMHADTIFTKVDSTTNGTFREIKVYHKAQLYGKTLQMRSDSVVFSLRDSIIKLFSNPIIWSDSSQLTADQINIKITNNDMKEIHLLDNALIAMQHDSIHFDQIKGQKIIGHLQKRQLQRANIDRRAEIIYFIIDDNQITSMNTSKCRNINLYFEDGQINEVIFIDTPEGKVTPIKDINSKTMYFRNFMWYDKLRPQKFEDIFVWKPLN